MALRETASKFQDSHDDQRHKGPVSLVEKLKSPDARRKLNYILDVYGMTDFKEGPYDEQDRMAALLDAKREMEKSAA